MTDDEDFDEFEEKHADLAAGYSRCVNKLIKARSGIVQALSDIKQIELSLIMTLKGQDHLALQPQFMLGILREAKKHLDEVLKHV